jgi:YD repeat-containing protein
MRLLLLAIICFASIVVQAQYEDERFPLTPAEIDYYKSNNIAQLVAIATENNRTDTTTTRYNKNGLLTYKHDKTASEKAYHYKYDKHNRLVEIVDSNYDAVFKKWWTNTTTFSYHKNGLLKERTLNGRSETYTFDDKLQLLKRIRLDESEEETGYSFYFNTQLQLIKTVEKDLSEVKTTVFNYNTLGKEIKTVAFIENTNSYDSIIDNTTYNNKSQITKLEHINVRASAMLDEEGEAMEGPFEVERETSTMQYVYNDKERLLTAASTKNNDILPDWEETHNYTLTNGIEVEQVTQKSYGKTLLEATITYNAPNGLKGEVKRKEYRKNAPVEITITYAYTFHK